MPEDAKKYLQLELAQKLTIGICFWIETTLDKPLNKDIGMIKINKTVIILFVLVFFSHSIYAATKQRVKNAYETDEAISLRTLATSDEKLESLMGMTHGKDKLNVRKKYVHDNEDVTIRYNQTFRGIPVLGDDVIVTRGKNGDIKKLHGYVVHDVDLDVKNITPALSSAQAMSIGKNQSMANEGHKLPIDSATYKNETSRLAIWLNKDSRAILVYEVSFVRYGETPSRPYYIIDAGTGEILDYFDNLQYASATGPGGNIKTGYYYYGQHYGNLDVTQAGSTCIMNNSNVKTVNLNHSSIGNSAYEFICPENTVKSINGAYSPLNDAHYFGSVIFNMFRDWLDATPLTFQLQMRVHYLTGYENAFWDGSSMTFGDGYTRYYPLVSLDIAAHEVAHGFTEQNSGLVYVEKSGGLNEAFSDMAGEAAEFYMTGSNDWEVGRQIFKGNGALRYMNNPPQDGVSIDHQSAYYQGIDVHYSSGVYNKAFYILAATPDWNTRKAFEVYARANMLYWSASTNWDDAGDGVMDAACDLGYDTDSVKASLAEVGITSDISPGLSCDQPQKFVWLVPIVNLLLL